MKNYYIRAYAVVVTKNLLKGGVKTRYHAGDPRAGKYKRSEKITNSMIKNLTAQEYGHKPIDYQGRIKRDVNREASIQYALEDKNNRTLPRFTPIKAPKRSMTAGIWNMCRQFLP